MPNIVNNLQAAFAQRSAAGPVGPAVSPQGPGLAPRPGTQKSNANPAAVEMQVKDMMARNPQVTQQVQQAVQQAMATGQLTPQELNTATQLARVALNDPSTYPRLRAFAIQNGIATEQDLPQQFDEGLLYVLLAIAEAMTGQGGAPQPGMQQQPQPGMQQQPGQEQGGYTIPQNVLQMKGQEFFDNLVKKYNPSGE